jgi:hypothetical protein
MRHGGQEHPSPQVLNTGAKHVQKITIGLSALLLVAAASHPSAAQDARTATTPQYPAACVEYVAEYMGCINYGELTEAQGRTARGHPLFVEPQTATASTARNLSAPPDSAAHASRPMAPTHQ